MNKKFLAVAVLAAGMGVSSVAFANPVCEAQKAAAPDLVEARDNNTDIDEVFSAIDTNASSEASATVLKESVSAIYQDESITAETAAEMIHQHCISKLGA